MYNNKVISNSDALLYSMPALEDERESRTKEEILHEAADIQRKAYEEGFGAGEKAGFAEGEQKVSALMERLENIIGEIARFKENLVTEVESQVVGLAVAMARKIILDEIRTGPEVMVPIVKEALRKMQRMGSITIKINPALHDIFLKKKSELTDIHEDIIIDIDSSVSITGPHVISQTEEVVTEINSLIQNIVDDMNAAGSEKVRERVQLKAEAGTLRNNEEEQNVEKTIGAERGGAEEEIRE